MISLAQTTEQMLSVEALPFGADEPSGDGGGGAFFITILMIALGGAIGYAVGFERGAMAPRRRRNGGTQWT